MGAGVEMLERGVAEVVCGYRCEEGVEGRGDGAKAVCMWVGRRRAVCVSASEDWAKETNGAGGGSGRGGLDIRVKGRRQRECGSGDRNGMWEWVPTNP